MEHSECNAKELGIAADSGTPRWVHAVSHTFFSDFHKRGEFNSEIWLLMGLFGDYHKSTHAKLRKI
jgi:hypothetical protein